MAPALRPTGVRWYEGAVPASGRLVRAALAERVGPVWPRSEDRFARYTSIAASLDDVEE
jgi:hypothetical protein